MADDITVTIEGLDRLLKQFNKAPKLVGKALERAMQKAVHHLHGKVAVYPPPPPSSTYRRTGTLGRSITTEVKGVGKDMLGIVGTAIPYATYVIGPKQAWMHRGRWKTMMKHVEEQMGKIREFFSQAADEVAKGLAGK